MRPCPFWYFETDETDLVRTGASPIPNLVLYLAVWALLLS
jgi:hypothetical protein